MRSVSFNFHRLTRSCKDRLFGEIRENKNQCCGLFARYLISEPTSGYLNGIYSVKTTIGTINIKLTLIEIQQTTFDLEMIAVDPAGNHYQGEQ